MSIGSTIKQMRRARDITQEQLAEYIGISSQAISQWECDKTAPDITQLPLLAYIFNVTTDEILGVDQQRTEAQIHAILEEAHIPYAAGDNHKAVEILKNGLQAFPRSYRIMAELADNLPCVGECREAIELCEKIITECTETDLRDEALQTMIYTYSNIGDKENAMRCAVKVPHMWFSREIYLAGLLEEPIAAQANLVEIVSYMAAQLAIGLRKLAEPKFGYTEEERLALLTQAADVIKSIYCNGDYCFAAQFPAFAHMDMAEIFASKNDAENTLSSLETACAFTASFMTYDENAKHTSPGVRGYESGGWIPSPDGSIAVDILKQLRESSLYDFVRSEQRFVTVVDTLKKYA